MILLIRAECVKFHDIFSPTALSSVQCLLYLPHEPILVRIKQGSDTLHPHFLLCPELVDKHFKVVDFRHLPLGPYLKL